MFGSRVKTSCIVVDQIGENKPKEGRRFEKKESGVGRKKTFFTQNKIDSFHPIFVMVVNL